MMKSLCTCGNKKDSRSKICRKCFNKNKRGQLARSKAEKNRYDKKVGKKFKRENFKKTYDFICANCGYEQWAKPSLMMTGFGMNQGHGSCLNCKQFLHLEIQGGLDGEKMVSMLWNYFLKRKEKMKEKTLRDKRVQIDEYHIEDYHYPEEDVKEFIDNLNILDIEHMTNQEFKEFIKKSAGKDLI